MIVFAFVVNIITVDELTEVIRLEFISSIKFQIPKQWFEAEKRDADI